MRANSTQVWLLYPGSGASAGQGSAYEDDGETTAAKAAPPGVGGHSSVTTARWRGDCVAEGGRLELSIQSRGRHAARASPFLY